MSSFLPPGSPCGACPSYLPIANLILASRAVLLRVRDKVLATSVAAGPLDSTLILGFSYLSANFRRLLFDDCEGESEDSATGSSIF